MQSLSVPSSLLTLISHAHQTPSSPEPSIHHNQMFWVFFFYYIYVLPEPIPREEGRGEYYNCAQSVFSVHFSPNGTSVCMALTYSVIMLRISL